MPITKKNTTSRPKKAARPKRSSQHAAIKKIAPPEKFERMNEIHKKTTFLP